MNDKAQEYVSARINLGSLSCMTGMLKTESDEGNFKLMTLQLMRQAEEQGIPASAIASMTFDDLCDRSIEFTVPVFIATDVFLIMVEASDRAKLKGDQGKVDAFKFLMAEWAPIALAALDHSEAPEFGPTDIRPSSLN